MRLPDLLQRRAGENEGYCMHCKCVSPFAPTPELRTTRNGFSQLTGFCATCGSPMHRFVKRDKPTTPPKPTRVIKVPEGAKGRIAEAAEFSGVSQGAVVSWLVDVDLDKYIVGVGLEMLEAGIKLEPRDLQLMARARARSQPRPADMPRRRTNQEEFTDRLVFGLHQRSGGRQERG